MAQGALFIGWGPVVTGREHKASQVFGESVQYFSSLEQQGDIESMEVVGLEAHGGDLHGFFLLHADEGKLAQLRQRDDFKRIVARATAVVENIGVVAAVTGNELGNRIQKGNEDTADLIG